MRRLRSWIVRFGGLFNKGRKDRELHDELESHIQMHMEDNLRSGMTPEQARVQALIHIGGIESTKEAYRDQRGLPLLETLWQDLRYGARIFRRNLGFTTVVLLVLALGIGAVTSVFSIVQGVLLKSPPFYKPEQIVLVSSVKATGEQYPSGTAAEQWREWRKETKSFSAMAAYNWSQDFLILRDGSEALHGLYVTADFFNVTGLKPQIGRGFASSDFPSPEAKPMDVVILGYCLWQRRFHGDPSILGKSIRLNVGGAGQTLTVIGVMPPDLRVLPSFWGTRSAGYDPYGQADFLAPISEVVSAFGPKASYWSVIGRLRAGINLKMAQAELTAIAARQGQTDPTFEGITPKVVSLTTALDAQARRLLLPLFGAGGLVFLIACGSLANLLLARGLQRQREYAVRCALGAGRWRLLRQSLVENMLVGILGGFLGAALAAVTVKLVKTAATAAVPRLDEVTVGWPMLLFCFAATLIAVVAAGFAPAIRASKMDAASAANGGTRTGVNRADRKLLGAVAMAQAALTLALLAGAGLLIRTAANLAQIRPGYETEHIVNMTVTELRQAQPVGVASDVNNWFRHFMDFHQRGLAQVVSLPGVKSAAWAVGVPLTGNQLLAAVRTDGSAPSEKFKELIYVPVRTITPEYFQTVGIPLLSGRNFGPADNYTNGGLIAIINEAMAKRYFVDADPVGKKFRMAFRNSEVGVNQPFGDAQIVGIAADSHEAALTEKAEPEVYIPYWQLQTPRKSLVVRSTGDPRSIVEEVERALRSVDPAVAIENVKTLEELRNDSIAPQLLTMHLLTAFSVVGGALAIIGIYGVLSLSVASRRQELAVRMAVGAQRRNVFGLVFGEGLRLVGVGILIGVLFAYASTRTLRALLFGVEPVDISTLAFVAVLFIGVAALACYFPARRATRIDPMTALRCE